MVEEKQIEVKSNSDNRADEATVSKGMFSIASLLVYMALLAAVILSGVAVYTALLNKQRVSALKSTLDSLNYEDRLNKLGTVQEKLNDTDTRLDREYEELRV